MNCSTPGLPVHHQLLEFTQAHVHRVGDAIQPSHPLSSPSPPAPNPSQHQGLPMSQLFAWDGKSIGVSALASFLPKNTQDWSPLEWTGCPISLQEVVKSTCPLHSCFLVALIWPLSKASFDYTYLWSVMSAKIWVWKDKRMLFFLYLLWSLTQNSMNSSLIWEIG